jgi:hypothetical protein
MSAGDTQHAYRVLWAQVVLQAKADLENEPIGSILYNHAAAFFVSRGDWAESRLIVADCLNMHPDDLSRVGLSWINDRRRREGLEPEAMTVSKKSEPLMLPRLVAVPAENSRSHRGRGRTPRTANPFNPFRERAAVAG